MQGVQDELRTAIPFAQVAHVDTENLETMSNRYGADFAADSTSDGNYSVNDFTYSNDTLKIDEQAVYGERIPLKELVHSGAGSRGGWDLVADRKNRHVRALGVAVHRSTYLNTLDGAGLILDNEVLGGSASALTPIEMSATNPDDVATKAYELMQNAGVSQSDGRPYIMIDPGTARFFKLFNMGAGFNTADRQLMTGFQVIPSFDFDYFVTPEVEHEVVVTFTDVNVATETLTVKGVTFTSDASPGNPGEVDVHGSTEEGAATNYAAAINNSENLDPSENGTLYSELTAANRAILRNAGVKATVDGAKIIITGFGKLSVTTDETNATVGDEQKNLLAGLRGSTHLALPSLGYSVEELTQVPGFTGSELRSTQIYDSTVWTKDKNRIAKIIVEA